MASEFLSLHAVLLVSGEELISIVIIVVLSGFTFTSFSFVIRLDEEIAQVPLILTLDLCVLFYPSFDFVSSLFTKSSCPPVVLVSHRIIQSCL